MTYSSRLIILRGNSGSGKSSVAKQVREKMAGKVAIIEQDFFRRIVLKEKDIPGGDNIDLYFPTGHFCIGAQLRCYSRRDFSS